MSEKYAEAEGPEEDFEIVEVNVSDYLTDEQKSWPVVSCESAAEEFAIEEPLPALDVRAAGGRLPALVVLFSDQEAALGGTGLEVSRQVAERDGVRATLVPRSVEGARGRLERVAKWAALAFGSEAAVTVV